MMRQADDSSGHPMIVLRHHGYFGHNDAEAARDEVTDEPRSEC